MGEEDREVGRDRREENAIRMNSVTRGCAEPVRAIPN